MNSGPGRQDDRHHGSEAARGAPGHEEGDLARNPALTLNAARIVQIFARNPGQPHYYTELARLARMPTGTAHLIVTRLAAAGWLDEAAPATGQEGPAQRRRLYTLSSTGLAASPAALRAARRQLDAINRDLGAGGPGEAAQVASAVRHAPAGPAAGRGGQDPETSLQVARIVKIFAGQPGQPRYHAELIELTGMPYTTVRKILNRLAAAGWLTAAPEDPGARGSRRGASRRLYTLTPAGAAAAPTVLAAARSQLAAINCDFRPGTLEAGPG